MHQLGRVSFSTLLKMRQHRNHAKLLMNGCQQRSFFNWNQVENSLEKQISEWVRKLETKDKEFKQPTALLLPLSVENPTLLDRNDTDYEMTVYVKGFLGSHTSTSHLIKQFKSADSDFSLSNDVSHFQSWKNSHEVLSLREVCFYSTFLIIYIT